MPPPFAHTNPPPTPRTAGFFAFHLWLCMRYRLFTRTLQAILQYTVLLLLCGVAVYEDVGVPFLAATLCTEAASALMLVSKLQALAGGLGGRGSW